MDFGRRHISVSASTSRWASRRRAPSPRAPGRIPGPGLADRPVRGEDRDRFRMPILVVSGHGGGGRAGGRGAHPVDARLLPCGGRLLPHGNRRGGHRPLCLAGQHPAQCALARRMLARRSPTPRLLVRCLLVRRPPARCLRARLDRRRPGLRPRVPGPGPRGGLPETVVERHIRAVFVQVTGHVSDPARIAAHGGREGHAARRPSRRNEQGGSPPARPGVGAHGCPAARARREFPERTAEGEWVTPVMLAVERVIAEVIWRYARVSCDRGSARRPPGGVEHGVAKPPHLVVADALEEPAHR